MDRRDQRWHEDASPTEPGDEGFYEVQRSLRDWRDRAFDQAWANARIVTSDTHQHTARPEHEPFVAEMRAEMLTTNAGWIEFCRQAGEATSRTVHSYLSALPPPRIWWQRGTATTGISIDVSRHAAIDETWEESILTIVVSLTDAAAIPAEGWTVIDQARQALVDQTRQWAVDDTPLPYMSANIRWRLLADASPCALHVPNAADIFAMTAIAIDEATERVWITVPWWRDDNDAGRHILERTLEAARRGCDARVITRPPAGQHNERSALSVLEQLAQQRNARIALNQTEHAKVYIADDVSVLASANLTWSDERNENSGTFTIGEATRQRARAFQHQWQGLAVADPASHGRT